jgi:hypothetical protein
MEVSHQIDQCEYPDPDNVDRVPEQAPAQQAPQHRRPENRQFAA